MEKFITIGALAEKVGISVRTLQYYDRTGLLKSTLSEGGRRMYTKEDIIRLQQILFFKSMGFSLEEIANKILKTNMTDLKDIFTEQREILNEEIKHLTEIAKVLDSAIEEIKSGKEMSLEKLMIIMEAMKLGNPYAFVLNYLSTPQLKNVTGRFEETGSHEQYAKNTNDLFTELIILYQKGTDPLSTEGQDFAKRWWNMVNEFTGGDPELLKSLVSAGADFDKWPEEAKPFQEAVKTFLAAALEAYFKNNNINLRELEVK